MLALYWECIDFKLKKIQGIFQKHLVKPLFFTNMFGLSEKQGIQYHTRYVVFTTIPVISCSRLIFIKKDKYHTLYVS